MESRLLKVFCFIRSYPMLSAFNSDFGMFYRNTYFKSFNPYHLNADKGGCTQMENLLAKLFDLIRSYPMLSAFN